MAYRGKKIDNPAAEMSIHVLQTKNDTGGKLLETTAGLASDGKVNKKGMPGILQVALMANKYSKGFGCRNRHL
jgi:hypothetical protein